MPVGRLGQRRGHRRVEALRCSAKQPEQILDQAGIEAPHGQERPLVLAGVLTGGQLTTEHHRGEPLGQRQHEPLACQRVLVAHGDVGDALGSGCGVCREHQRATPRVGTARSSATSRTCWSTGRSGPAPLPAAPGGRLSRSTTLGPSCSLGGPASTTHATAEDSTPDAARFCR